MYLPGRLGLRFGGERISTRDPDRPGSLNEISNLVKVIDPVPSGRFSQ